jgi:hypothetical protein
MIYVGKLDYQRYSLLLSITKFFTEIFEKILAYSQLLRLNITLTSHSSIKRHYKHRMKVNHSPDIVSLR